MSNQVSDQTDKGSADGGNPETKDTVAYDTHRKLLGEKKQTQAQLNDALAKLEALEQDKLSTEGKKDELIQKLQKSKSESDDKVKKLVGAFHSRTVLNKFVEKAKEAGCVDPVKLAKLADLSTVEVDVDNDFAVNEESVTSLIDGLKKDASFFFQKSPIKINDQTPNNNIETKPGGEKKLTDLSREDLMKLARSLDQKGI